MKLHLTLRPARGALERALTAITFRRFEPIRVAARRSEEGLHVEIELSGPGDPNHLVNALKRLFDVVSVEVVI